MLDNTTNWRFKSRTIDWIKMMIVQNNQIKFETKMFKVSLCDNSDYSYMFIKWIITIDGERDAI